MFRCIRKAVILSFILNGEIPITHGVAMDQAEEEFFQGKVSKILYTHNNDGQLLNKISNHIIIRNKISEHIKEYNEVIVPFCIDEVSDLLNETIKLMILVSSEMDAGQIETSAQGDMKTSPWNEDVQLRDKILNHIKKYNRIITPSSVDIVVDFLKKTAETVVSLGFTAGIYQDEIISPWVMPASSLPYDARLREGILNHIKDHWALFTPAGLDKVDGFLQKLSEFDRGAILFRSDTLFILNGKKIDKDDFKEAILSLLTDYKLLNLISSLDTPIPKIIGSIMDVKLNFYLSDHFDLGIQKLNKCEKQYEVFNIITGEAEEYFTTQKEKEPGLLRCSSVSIINMLGVQEKFIKFLSNERDLMKKIEMERRSFDLMLKRLYDTNRDSRLNAIIDESIELKGLYEDKIAEKIGIENYHKKIEAEKKEQDLREEEEARVRGEAYDQQQKNKTEMKRSKKKLGSQVAPLQLPSSSGGSVDLGRKKSSDPSRSSSKSPKKYPETIHRNDSPRPSESSPKRRSGNSIGSSHSPTKKSIDSSNRAPGDSLMPPGEKLKSSGESPRSKSPKRAFFGFGRSDT